MVSQSTIIVTRGRLKAYLRTMYQARPGQVPVNKACHCSNSIEGKPEHQVLWAVPTIDGNYLVDTDTQIIHKPVPNTCDAVEELSICPCLAFEDEEWAVWLVAEGVVFEDVVGQNTLAHDTVGYEVHDFFRGSEPTASMLEVVGNVEFGVEVGRERRCAGCSGENGYFDALGLSLYDKGPSMSEVELTRHCL